VPTGELVCTWSTGRCWRTKGGVRNTAGEAGGEMSRVGDTSVGATFATGCASRCRRLLKRFLKSVLGVEGVGGRRPRIRRPEEEVGLMGDVVMPTTRRRCRTKGLMRRRPGRARLIDERGSQGTNTPDVEPSPFAERT